MWSNIFTHQSSPCRHEHEDEWKNWLDEVLHAVRNCCQASAYCVHLPLHGTSGHEFVTFLRAKWGDDALLNDYWAFLAIAGLVDSARGIQRRFNTQKKDARQDGNELSFCWMAIYKYRHLLNNDEMTVCSDMMELLRKIITKNTLDIQEFEWTWEAVQLIKARRQIEHQQRVQNLLRLSK